MQKSHTQIDFLIITNTGIYCIEVKDKPYQDIRINGPWQYADRATGRIVDDVNSSGENPYEQATNSADSLKSWISKERSRVFSTRTQQPQLDQHGVIEGLKVFPAVLIPKSAKHPKQERDNWCHIYVGVDELRQFSKRKWDKFTLSADEIMRIADLLSLERISPAELRRPELSRHFQYCRDLMDEMNSLEPLLDYYVPNDLEPSLRGEQLSFGTSAQRERPRPSAQGGGPLLHNISRRLRKDNPLRLPLPYQGKRAN